MHGIRITVEGCTKGPIVVECPAPNATPEEWRAAMECESDEHDLQVLKSLQAILKHMMAIELEQQRQAQRITVQGRRQTEILRIVRRIEHPTPPPHVPTTMVVTFGQPVPE